MSAGDRRRSVHFVPGGNEKMMARALTLPADGLILDLEDAVPPDRKVATRPIVARWLRELDFGGRERWVRMNPLATGLGRAIWRRRSPPVPTATWCPSPIAPATSATSPQLLDRLEHQHGMAQRQHPAGAHRHRDARGPPQHPRDHDGQPAHLPPSAGGSRTWARPWRCARVRDAEGRFLDIPRHARVMCAVVGGGRRGPGPRHRVHRHRGPRRPAARVRGGRGHGVRRQDLHPPPPDRGHQRRSSRRRPPRSRRRASWSWPSRSTRGRGVYAFRFKGLMVDAPHLARARKIIARAGG